jgi:hypothetical protein
MGAVALVDCGNSPKGFAISRRTRPRLAAIVGPHVVDRVEDVRSANPQRVHGEYNGKRISRTGNLARNHPRPRVHPTRPAIVALVDRLPLNVEHRRLGFPVKIITHRLQVNPRARTR